MNCKICVKIENLNQYATISSLKYDPYLLPSLKTYTEWDFDIDEYYLCSDIMINIECGIAKNPPNNFLKSLKQLIKNSDIPLTHLYLKWN